MPPLVPTQTQADTVQLQYVLLNSIYSKYTYAS